jgi:hypothetical protein
MRIPIPIAMGYGTHMPGSLPEAVVTVATTEGRPAGRFQPASFHRRSTGYGVSVPSATHV